MQGVRASGPDDEGARSGRREVSLEGTLSPLYSERKVRRTAAGDSEREGHPEIVGCLTASR